MFKKKSKQVSDLTLFLGCPEGVFHCKRDHPGLFLSHVGEILFISRRWREGSLSVQPSLSRAESTKIEGSGRSVSDGGGERVHP